jgi:hypothetical protein
MQAAAKGQRVRIASLGVKRLLGSIVKETIGLVSTGDLFLDLLIQTTGEGIKAAIAEESIVPAISGKVAEKIGGFILAKSTNDWFGATTASVIQDLSRNEIERVLNEEGVLTWNLSGDNFAVHGRGGLTWELAKVEARLYYNPWNHYTTAIIAANCQSENGRSYQNVYVVTYENEKTGFGGAVPKLDTVVRRLILEK